MSKLIKYPYAARRLKQKAKDFMPNLVHPVTVKYRDFLDEAFKKHPNIFDVSGNFRKVSPAAPETNTTYIFRTY
jgi:hypothetical protein